jgi:hypothetical protein
MAQMKPLKIEPAAPPPTTMQKILDVVERVGNRVPHPVIIFVILIGIVIVLSHIFYMLGLSVSYESGFPGDPCCCCPELLLGPLRLRSRLDRRGILEQAQLRQGGHLGGRLPQASIRWSWAFSLAARTWLTVSRICALGAERAGIHGWGLPKDSYFGQNAPRPRW